MKRNLDYIIVSDYNLIIEIAKGEIDFADYIQLKIREAEDPLYNANYNFIVDLRNAVPKNNLKIEKEFQLYISHVKNIPNVLNNRKSAFITDTPQQVVAVTFYKMLSDLPIIIEVFTTFESAIQWLNVESITPEIVESLIENKIEK